MMQIMFDLPIRPELSLPEILFYAFFAFAFALILTKRFVAVLHRYKIGKKLRVEAVDGASASVFLQYHQNKKGTPTMGGVLIWASILVTVLVSRAFAYFGWVDHSLLQRGQVYVPLGMMLGFGLLGAVDDYMNVAGIGKNKGMSWLPKLLMLILMSAIAASWFYFKNEYTSIYVPFGEMLGLTDNVLQLGWLYIPFAILVIIGTANAVNVTDGLDGLAGGLLIIAFGSFGLVAYISGLYILAGFCAVVAGAIAAFLWHNVPPALFYMGDTGSLALGGTLAVIAFMINHVLLLPLIGFVFVAEMLSVIIQLTSKKFFKRKVFKSAPFHHHLEALQWGESKVTMRLWIIGAFVAFLGVLVGMYG